MCVVVVFGDEGREERPAFLDRGGPRPPPPPLKGRERPRAALHVNWNRQKKKRKRRPELAAGRVARNADKDDAMESIQIKEPQSRRATRRGGRGGAGGGGVGWQPICIAKW